MYLSLLCCTVLSCVLLAISGRNVLLQLLEASIARLADRGTWVQWQWNEHAPSFETASAFRHADRNSQTLPVVCEAGCIPHTPDVYMLAAWRLHVAT